MTTGTDLAQLDPARHSAVSVVAALGLRPHREGGFYRETFRDHPVDPAGRGAVMAILFLLSRGQISHWHKVDATEIWLWHAGAPLRLDIGRAGKVESIRLGTALAEGAFPQAVVAVDEWQRAESLGDWSLVSCIVAPAFRFEGFTMAPPGWSPPS